jgi:probable rRNA maturation factor
VDKWLQQVAALLGGSMDVVEVTVVDDEFIRRINREYRGRDRATDVISFCYPEDDPPCEENIVGEIYISFETIEKEAKEQAVDPKFLFLRIALHGLLHILGYTHDTDANANRMEAEEKKMLGKILSHETVDALF